jgi:hypothetical protein
MKTMAKSHPKLTRETKVPEPQVTRMTRFLVLTTALLLAWPLCFGIRAPSPAHEDRQVDKLIRAHWELQAELNRAEAEIADLRLKELLLQEKLRNQAKPRVIRDADADAHDKLFYRK